MRGLAPDEALELIAQSLCQAIFHDLEKSTGVNVWTFAQNIAGGWFERSGEWAPLRALMDILATSARAVVDEIGTPDANLGFLLVGRGVARARRRRARDRWPARRALESRRCRADQGPRGDAGDARRSGRISTDTELGDTGDRFIERPTVPFMRPDRPVTSPGESTRS